MLYFTLSVLLLTALLSLPATRLIWVLSVRRLQRKTGQTLPPAEIDGQHRRARFLAIVLSFIFSLLFNIQLLGWPGHG